MIKSESVSSYLGRKFGGKWKYNRASEWHCDDGIRYVCHVLTGRDHNGEYTGESRKCMYYKDGSHPPQWVW